MALDSPYCWSFADRVYIEFMRMTKHSVELEFIADDGFDKNKFKETSIPERLSDMAAHDLSLHLNFNIIRGFRYNDELADRSYDNHFTVFRLLKAGKKIIIYSNFNNKRLISKAIS